MSRQVAVPKFSTSQAPGGQPDWQQYNRALQALAIFQQSINAQPPLASPGSTSGNMYGTMPFQGASFKFVLLFCDAVVGTAHYNFPTPFVDSPAVLVTGQGGLPTTGSGNVITALTGTGITVASTGGPLNGFIFIVGF